jgi:phospholipase C
LVNAVMQSNYWQNCAIIIVWDDYGGFYDHVPPKPQSDGFGYGFRVPALVISPYSNVGIVHETYDLTSLLKLVETAFGLPSLTGRDGKSNTMLDCFNFSQAPLPPIIITPDTKLDFSKLKPTKP